VCFGLGHRTCKGGTLPLNAFGEAFKAAGSKWTAEFCAADSDGDGVTNGEELGDPCCTWSAYDTLSAAMLIIPTHPGDPNHFDEGFIKPTCGPDFVPLVQAEPLGVFNDDEEVFTVDMLFDDYEIPTAQTTYVDIGLNFDDDSQGTFYAVRVEAIVQQPDYLHHFIISACDKKFSADMNGKEIRRMETCDGRRWGAWAPGKCIFCPPRTAAKPLGADVGAVAFSVQVHYNNRDAVPGVKSSDGIRIHYLKVPRLHTLAKIPMMELSNNPMVYIPPGHPRYFITRSCQLTVQAPEGVDDPESKIHMATVGYHAHLLGTEMYTEVKQLDKAEPFELGSEPVWHFDDQYDRNILPLDISFKTGDHIQSTCVFNSTGRPKNTYIAIRTEDEMCWADFSFWPGNMRVSCEGPIWLGSLEPDEIGLGIASRHTVDDSDMALSGAFRLDGGTVIKARENAETCGDALTAEMCEEMMDDMGTMAAGGGAAANAVCDIDLGMFEEEIPAGMTLIKVCCELACENVCPDHQACQPTTTTTTTTTANLVDSSAATAFLLAGLLLQYTD